MGTIKEDTVELLISIETALAKMHKMAEEDWEELSKNKENFNKILNVMSQLTESLKIINQAAVVDEKREKKNAVN